MKFTVIQKQADALQSKFPAESVSERILKIG